MCRHWWWRQVDLAQPVLRRVTRGDPVKVKAPAGLQGTVLLYVSRAKAKDRNTNTQIQKYTNTSTSWN